MGVKIRLARRGSKHLPYFSIVATDSRSPRDGRFIEKLGTYNPKKNPAEVVINYERVDYWRSKGAQLSQIVDQLLKKNPKPKSE